MTRRPTAVTAALLYVAATLAMTWPLIRDLTHTIPGDLGDSLLNGYLLAWGEKHLLAFLSGDVGAFGRWWQANIFYPAPYALAYSEHLFTEVAMALPVWIFTKDEVLAYNVVFLASFALSGLGMFLLLRELTDSPRAAFVAGLAFAFVPYRLAQTAHLQVLSSEWMPWTIYALRRYFVAGRLRSLGGALAALVAQQLACGYYLIYFTPVVATYVVWELTARGRWRDAKLLVRLALVGAIDAVLVWPFLSPYLELRRLGFPPRPLDEVAHRAADVWGYVTASSANRLWGSWLRAWTQEENDLFPGMLLVSAALFATIALAMTRWRETASLTEAAPWRRQAIRVLVVVTALGASALLLIVWTSGVTIRSSGVPLLRLHDGWRLLIGVTIGGGGILWLSRRARALCTVTPDLRPWAGLVIALAWLFSLGPMPHAGGRDVIIPAPYLYSYEFVPGFDGLRVPARMAMVCYLGLAVLAGYGLASIDRRSRGARWMSVAALAVLVETTGVPYDVNRIWNEPTVARPPAEVGAASQGPPVYQLLASLPAGRVVAEFPFGYPSWELRYVFHASWHEQHLLNGYSGGFPDSYIHNANLLMRPLERPDLAWACLLTNGVTHVVVHRDAFLSGDADPVMRWIEGHGARHLATFGGDELFEVLQTGS